MIINYTENGWQVITQRAHGIVAAQAAMQWKVSERPKRWLETILAVAEHDDAEIELASDDLITETGGPVNFAMKKFEKEHCEQMSMLTLTKSRYMALLVSMHMDFLYRKEEQENEEVHKFLEEQRRQQKIWCNELGIDRQEAERIYYLLEWCDAFSLIICRQQLQPEKRGVEISTGPDGAIYTMFQLEEGVLTVNPWPFQGESFTINYETRTISQLKFENSKEFKQAFITAPVQEVVWEIRNNKAELVKPKKI